MANVSLRKLTLLVAVSLISLPAFAAVQLPVSGTAKGGGDFAGTVSISRFEARGQSIVAIGLVSGVLTRGNKAVASAVVGEIEWNVTLSTNNPAAKLRDDVSVQQSCSVAHSALGGQDINVRGASVMLSPITFDLAGEKGTPLGDLICAAEDLLGNVAAVVELLNRILGLLTGLLGGGGGAVPPGV